MNNNFKRSILTLTGWLIPSRIRLFLFRSAFAIMPQKQKDDVRRFFHIAALDTSLRNMQSLGFNPERIVDVGAYIGNWTRLIRDIFPYSNVLMIEAQEGKIPKLKEAIEDLGPGIDFESALLSANTGEDVTFYELETGSSVLPENSHVPRKAHILRTKTLDDVLAERDWNHTDLLKLDVQGYELEVLKGADTVLANTEVVLLEVSLLQINEGAPLLADVVQFMNDRSFRVYDFCSFIRRPLDKALWQTDILFVHSQSKLLTKTSFD